MHELSIAADIVRFALSEASANGSKKVSEISVEVGELTQVEPKVLSDALALLLKGPVLEGCSVVVTMAPASFTCRRCSSRWGMAEVKKELAGIADDLLVREPESREAPMHFLPQLYSAFVHCPACGSSDVEATQGDDVRVRRLGLE